MNGKARVYNQTRNCWMKYSSAMKGEQQCALVWVIPGEVVRQATLRESIDMRNEQARLAEPLCMAEIPGVVFKHPAGSEGREERRILMFEANAWPKLATSMVQ